MAKPIYESLRETGRVVRGYLGVGIQDVTQDLAELFSLEESKGVLVSDVAEESPAERGGLERGDVIVGYQEMPVEDAVSLQRMVTRTPIDQQEDALVLLQPRDELLIVLQRRDRLPVDLTDYITPRQTSPVGATPGEYARHHHAPGFPVQPQVATYLCLHLPHQDSSQRAGAFLVPSPGNLHGIRVLSDVDCQILLAAITDHVDRRLGSNRRGASNQADQA